MRCQRFDGVLSHRAQLELSELAATYRHGTHRQGSALPIAGSEGHSGPRSAVGDGRAHVVLLRSGVTADRQPGRERALCLHSGITRMLGALPGDRRKFFIWTSGQHGPAPGLSSAVQRTPRSQQGHTCYRMASFKADRGSIGVPSRIAADRRTIRGPAMRSSGMGRLATVPVAAGHDSASAREAPVDVGSNYGQDARQALQ